MRIVIDGNIGSGKTTQLDLLEKIGHTVHREAIDDWPLDEFYKDPSRWAFLLHASILLSNQPKGTGIQFIERSILSSRWVFWEVLKKDGKITRNEDKIYSKLFNKHSWHPDVFIYLAKSPEKCYEHIQKRTQPGDQAITLQYLKDLDIEYMRLVEGIPGCKVLVVDAERPAEEIHEEIYKYLVGNELLSTNTERSKV
jgi:deoxyadenosine/deoxycytidine kinase